SVVMTDNADPIETSGLKSWSNILEIFTKPDPKFDPKAQIVGQIWTDETQTALWMVPSVFFFEIRNFAASSISAAVGLPG
ncbi:ABC transporter substrate-binding protein, partial [Rhizobium leguminosarum]